MQIRLFCLAELILIFSAGNLGCTVSSDSNSPQVIDHVEKLEVIQQIEKVLETPPCKSLDYCDTVMVSISPKTASASSIGQRILVIDSGMLLPAYTRYKSRVLDYLIAREDGRYESTTEEIRVSRTVFEVLSKILDERFPETTAKQLNSVSKSFHQHTKILKIPIGHGDQIFSTLADRNPKAEFVVAQLFREATDGFCSAVEDKTAWEKSRVILHNAASSLKNAIKKHEINFVNMSFGEEEELFKTRWNRECTGKPLPSDQFFLDFQKMYFENFYQQLFDLENVIFVQSAPESSRALEKNDSEFYVDCQDVSNRITASGFSSLEPKLGIRGGEAADLLPDYLAGPLPCTDLVINFGVSPKEPYEAGEFPILMTLEGVGVWPIGRWRSNSIAAPNILSYLNYLKQSGLVAGNGREFVANIKKYHEGKFVEPERYQQFEIYRLGRQ